jgi:LPS-assembly protein
LSHTLLLGLVLCIGAAAQDKPVSNPISTVPKLPPPASLTHGEWVTRADEESSDGPVKKLKGHAELESNAMLIRADDIQYDESAGDVVAHGHVYFHSFEKNEQLWCDHMEYNTEEQKGKFWDVKGETAARVVVRKGVLSGSSPYHWEGEWAERVGERYFLYNGWMTNCKMPNPWWRMKGPKFEIVQYEYAKSWKSWFILRKMPLFYAPYFYRSLQKQPRHSGFLTPNIVPRSQRGFMVGVGYFWAINRSYDLTYRFQDYNTNAFAHHVDFRGKPNDRTDYDLILYDVQDRGLASGGSAPPQKFGGLNISFLGRSDLGNGWNALGQVDYTTSYRFRQYWSQSVNEVIGSEIHSLGFLNKNWSSYTFDVAMSRVENFQTPEVQEPGSTSFTRNAVLLHKLPEADLSSRDRQIWDNVPLWFSFYSAAGLLYRSESIFDSNTNPVNLVENYQTRQFVDRVHLAPHITSAFHLGFLSFVPSFGLDETVYGQSQAPTGQVLNGQELYRVVDTSLVRSARDFSLDIIFPSLARVFNKKTIFGDKLKHVIEPRATYRYVNGIGDDYNRLIRFDDTELLSNTNEVELSLTNRIYAKRGDNVQEIFTWELKQKRYFDPTFGGALVAGQPNLFAATADLTAYSFLVGPRSTSPVASVLRASPIPGLSFNWQSDYDPRYRSVVDSYFSVDYHFLQKYFVTAGNDSVHADPLLLTPAANQYRFRVGFGDPQHRGWNAAVDGAYDYKLSRLSYAVAQVTYNTDCCGFSVQLRRINIGLRDENLYSFSFAIANIGSFGSLKKNDRLF